MRCPAPLFALSLAAAFAARADEGMWTYDNFPSARVGQKYGFTPDAKWLQEAQLSSVRLAGGCSGSFVSGDGLVMTNHHCAHSCIEQLSTKDKDFVKEGFFAPALQNEVKCPEIELNQLLGISDVTQRVKAATQGIAPGKEFDEKRKAVRATIEKECSAGDDKARCDVVELYHGGVYSLYRYKRFQDVRLVFAPEFGIAFFGGDPDNFNFPRYDLDVSFVRAYEDGKPAKTDHHFRWGPGAKDGELTFVSGHPGGTDRELTVAELRYQRDIALPERLLQLAEYRGALTMFTKSSPEHYRVGEAELFGVENSFKALKGRFEALVTPSLWNSKVQKEKELRAKVDQSPQLKASYGKAWDQVATAIARFAPRRKEFRYEEQGAAFNYSRLFRIARTLVRGTVELQKPNDQRLPEYTESKLPALKQQLFSKAPIYPEFELFKLSYGLTKLREDLGADHPFVKKVLGKMSPEELAQKLSQSKLSDVALREQLWNDGKGGQALAQSTDPMIEIVRLIEPEAREIRRWDDEQVNPLNTQGDEQVAAAKFDVYGRSTYPDATFTLRLSYGAVKGYEENGHHVNPVTFIGGAFERATGREPFKLPESWTAANAAHKLNLATPFNLASTNDIIGGNSGSPVFNKELQIVGLIFDGNIQSLGGDYGFDETVNRAVAVEAPALVEALDHVYGAKRLVEELKGAGGGATGAR